MQLTNANKTKAHRALGECNTQNEFVSIRVGSVAPYEMRKRRMGLLILHTAHVIITNGTLRLFPRRTSFSSLFCLIVFEIQETSLFDLDRISSEALVVVRASRLTAHTHFIGDPGFRALLPSDTLHSIPLCCMRNRNTPANTTDCRNSDKHIRSNRDHKRPSESRSSVDRPF